MVVEILLFKGPALLLFLFPSKTVLPSPICLFSSHTFIYLSFLFLDPHCPILLSLGSTPNTCPWMLSFTLEGTFSVLDHKTIVPRHHQTLLPQKLFALSQESESLKLLLVWDAHSIWANDILQWVSVADLGSSDLPSLPSRATSTQVLELSSSLSHPHIF